jgi:hypothetical protein
MTIRAALLVSDAAQLDSDGRLYLLGAGVQVMPTPTPPHALVLRLLLDAAEALVPHEVRVALLDATGSPVLVPGAPSGGTGPAGLPGMVTTQPLQLGQDLPALAADVADLPDWGPVSLPLLFNLGPGLPVRSGPHRWQVTVDGAVLDEAVVLFLDPQPAAQA